MGVRDEPLGGDKMNYNNSKSTSESTRHNSQKTRFANDMSNDMGWNKEQSEILQQCHEEETASKETYDSIPLHGFTCNCVECN